VRQTLIKSAFQTPANWNSPHGKNYIYIKKECKFKKECDEIKFGTKHFVLQTTPLNKINQSLGKHIHALLQK